MRQCICIHVGQAGLQIGSALWQLFSIEHAIKLNGELHSTVKSSAFSEYAKTFFSAGPNEKMIPRAVMVDLEPTVLDEIRTGPYKDFYHPNQLISGKEDASNNYARGYYTVGKQMLDSAVDTITKVVEQCESIQGFIIFHSSGGGTGSGFGTLLMEKIVNDFPKKTRLDIVVYPAPQVSTSIVEPYNSVLSTQGALSCGYSDCTFMVDNEALYEICHKKLNVERPTYSTLNRMISQVVSSLTASLRFDGLLNVDLSEFEMNLVPYPKLHFPITAYSPIVPKDKVYHDNFSIHDITKECFDSSNQLVKCDLKKGKFMACCLLYRGDIILNDINTAVSTIKKRRNIKFVEWCPTGFKIGVNNQPPCHFPSDESAKIQRGVCMLANTTSIADSWDRLGRKFDLMYNKKAFVHWFLTEGMEEEQFIESRNSLEVLQLDYREVQGNMSEFLKKVEAEI